MKTTITTSAAHGIPAGVVIAIDDKLFIVTAATSNTITIRSPYWWEDAWWAIRYWARQAWRWVRAWVETRRAVKKAAN